MISEYLDSGLDLKTWCKENSIGESTIYEWKRALIKKGYDGGESVEFLDVYRDEEYIRQHTKGMNSEEARRFALAYYVWDDKPAECMIADSSEAPEWLKESSIPEELPFN